MSGASFLEQYVSGELSDFYELAAGDTTQALNQKREVNRPVLVAALERYAKELNAPPEVFTSLEQLAHPNSRTVVTGQQTGLLLGPTFTLSKAITAIKLARQLSTPDKPVVPVFWCASQDHDTEEIDHAYILDLDEQLHRLEVPLTAGTASGRIALEASWLETVLAELGELNLPAPHVAEVSALLTDSFAASSSYADWFAALLYRLLGSEGLLVLNPLTPDMAVLFRPVLEAELANPAVSVAAINEAASRVRAAGFEPQLGRGASATNLFLEEKTAAGYTRQALKFDGKRFSTDVAEYSRADLLARLDADPSAITPAAGLRPITQDAALPNAVTVVGPGELRYFAQLRGVYAHHKVPMSLIWKRAQVTLLEPPVRRILSKFELRPAEVQADFESVKETVLLTLNGHAEVFSTTLAELEVLLESLTEQVRNIDPTLVGTITRGEGYLKRTVANFRTKSAKALDREDDIYARQLDRLAAHLLPLGQPQERLLSPFSFFLKFGIQPIMTLLLDLPAEGEHDINI